MCQLLLIYYDNIFNKNYENMCYGTSTKLYVYYFVYIQIAEEVLAMRISLRPEEILELAEQINSTIQGLQNIEDILADTKDNLTLAQMLKERADNAS